MLSSFQTIKNILLNIYIAPLNQNNRTHAYFKFLRFQLISRISSKPITFNWINDSILEIHRGDIGLTGNYYAGIIDFNQISFICHTLDKNTTFVDVGSNLGEYSIAAAKVTGVNCISFEPDQESFKKMQNIVNINNCQERIECHNKAVSYKSRQVMFTTGLDSLNHIEDNLYTFTSRKVEAVCLDDVLDSSKKYLVKIDTEGHELQVLMGMLNLFKEKSILALIVEVNDSETHKFLIQQNFIPIDYLPLKREFVVLKGISELTHDTIYVINYEYLSRLKYGKKFYVHHGKGHLV
jgi:FkbM family methyltransferase